MQRRKDVIVWKRYLFTACDELQPDRVRSGVPEIVGMISMGRKTRLAFDRYNIVSETDLQSASEKIVQLHKEQAGETFSKR